MSAGAAWPGDVFYLAIDPCGGFLPLHDLQIFTMESLILAQNERWRRGLGMQVERERGSNTLSKAANW